MMDVLTRWLDGYLGRNYTDVVQGLFFAAATVFFAFPKQRRMKKVWKFVLSFLVSYNTAQFFSGLLYSLIQTRFPVKGTLLDFLVATGCLIAPLPVLILLYTRVLEVPGPAAAFFYTLFFSCNCMAMILAQTAFQRMVLTLGLSIFLAWYFRREFSYLLFEKSMLRMDYRFRGTADAFMVMIGCEAELPRIVLDGSHDEVGGQLAYGVAIAGSILMLFFVIFMKFSFFAIMKYENFIRAHDEDASTGARSLTYLIEHGKDRIQSAGKRGQVLAVFYTDIDNFRDINLLHGYEAGTGILKRTAELLAVHFPEGIIARSSGTHFAGLVPMDCAEGKFESVARQVEELSLDEPLHLRVGLCPVPAEESRRAGEAAVYKKLVSLLDLAASALLYQGKDGQIVQVYDAEIKKQEEIRLHVLTSVDKAVRNRWLRVCYQPLVEVRTGRLAGFEALSRWMDPTYGYLTPDKFVGPLEGVRLIYKVDLNVLRTYGGQIARLKGMGISPLPISFNISRADLESGIDLYSGIENILRNLSIDRHLIHVEITESALNGDSQVMPQAVERFHAMGLEVWMDDFGSGYSSLNVLKDYRFDVIKIDMAFLRKFDERSKVIVRSICEMARSLGIRTVAEGVETREQFAFLEEVGCTYAQGYLFSKPRPAEEFYEVIKNQKDFRKITKAV